MKKRGEKRFCLINFREERKRDRIREREREGKKVCLKRDVAMN